MHTGVSLYAVCMRTRSLQHCVYRHQYHIVWGTKYRRKFLTPAVREEFLTLLFTLVKKYPTLFIHAVNARPDHVHLQIEIPPDISVARAVQRFKGHTSRRLKQKYSFIRRIYLDSGIWSVGYFSSTLGLNEQQVKLYIAHQGRLDRSRQIRFGFS